MKEHKIEELLRRADPEPDEDTLRMTPDTVRVRSAAILDGRDTMRTQYQQPLQPAETPRGSRQRSTLPGPLGPSTVGAGSLNFRVRNGNGWNLAVAAGFAAFVLVVIGGVGLLSVNGGEDLPPAGQTALNVTQPTTQPSSSPATTAPLVTEPQMVPPGSWTRVALDSQTFPSGFEDVVAGTAGFVAVGLPGAGTSPDGVSWQLTSSDVVAIDVTVGDGGLVAFDRSGSGPAVWNSADGTTWTSTLLDDAAFAELEEINATAHSDLGYVAVGVDNSDGTAAVWTSVDGTGWPRVAIDAISFRGEMLGITYGDNGYVAVGRSSNNDGVAEGAVWTSVDGIAWARVLGVSDGVMYDVTFGNGRYVAVGVEGGTASNPVGWHAAVWTSTDGTTWGRVPHDDEAFAYRDQELAVGMDAVAYGSAGFVAVGDAITDTPDGDQRAAIWYSADGTTWERVSHDEDLLGGNVGLNSVAVIGSNWVAVGREIAITWTWRPLG